MSLLVGVIVAGLLISLPLLLTAQRVERFVAFRYLFRLRRSRSLIGLTVLSGVASVALPAAVVLGKWEPGSIAQTTLMVLSEPARILFVVLALLNFSSVFTAVSVLGVDFGVAALIVVLSVTSGFQGEFQNKVLGVNAHVLVLKYGLDFSEYRDVMKKAEAVPHVKAAAPFIFHEMMVAHGPTLSGVLVKGIVPAQSTRVIDVADRMVEGSVSALDEKIAPKDQPQSAPLPGILVGKELAKKLKVKVGDRVRLISPMGSDDPSLWEAGEKAPRLREFRVGGVFYSGFDEYDRRLVYIQLKEGQKFLGGQDVVTGVEMRIDDIYKSREVVDGLDAAFANGPYRTLDWRELNHNLFTALKLQKLALAILLTLIVLVAAFGIVATLTMLVIDKTQEIAILKSVGMRSGSIARLFMTAGLVIGALGATAGISHGLVICEMLSRYQYRLDPKVYLIDKLPVDVHVGEVALTVLVTLVICLVATIYPSVRAARLRPVEGLRYE